MGKFVSSLKDVKKGDILKSPSESEDSFDFFKVKSIAFFKDRKDIFDFKGKYATNVALIKLIKINAPVGEEYTCILPILPKDNWYVSRNDLPPIGNHRDSKFKFFQSSSSEYFEYISKALQKIQDETMKGLWLSAQIIHND